MITSSAYPLWHVGTRKWINMTQLLVINIKWKIMHEIHRKIWSLAWTHGILISELFCPNTAAIKNKICWWKSYNPDYKYKGFILIFIKGAAVCIICTRGLRNEILRTTVKQNMHHDTWIDKRDIKEGVKQLGFKMSFLKANFFQNLDFKIRLCSTCKLCNLGSINKKDCSVRGK
jgi:hypothetical protein